MAVDQGKWVLWELERQAGAPLRHPRPHFSLAPPLSPPLGRTQGRGTAHSFHFRSAEKHASFQSSVIGASGNLVYREASP